MQPAAVRRSSATKRILAFAAITAVVVALPGCQPAGSRLIGRWQGTALIVTVEFEAKADGTALFTVRPPIGNAVVQNAGSWKAVKAEGDKLTFALTDDKGTTSTPIITFLDDNHFVWTPPEQTVQIEFTRMVDSN